MPVTTSGSAMGATSTKVARRPVRPRRDTIASANPRVVTTAGTRAPHSSVRAITVQAPCISSAVRKWRRPTKPRSSSVTLTTTIRSTGHSTNAPRTNVAGSSRTTDVTARG